MKILVKHEQQSTYSLTRFGGFECEHDAAEEETFVNDYMGFGGHQQYESSALTCHDCDSFFLITGFDEDGNEDGHWESL